MSNTIDDRVVSLRFNNKDFETNVSKSLNTLDKLKQKLNFSKSSKALNDLNTAANKVNFNGLGSGVDTLQAKFSALQVVGYTALNNITNTAVNAGKRIASALTIDPIKTGFNEYETKINAIQTIMSNTASKGTTMSQVTKTLDELNTYADKTIYNFAEMTRNIGTFTAAGVGLEESAKAIQGIANLAAASGSNSQQASMAMYQLSQALASGTIRLMDWNSVVNAGMGGEKFQNALKATAREHGIAVDAMIEKEGSFRESLSKGWLSAEIMNETLNKFTVDGAKKYAQAMMESGKYTEAQADALIKEAQSMEDAATKVKTFTQLWDTLKETAQSGWAKTWELIFGDFEQARNLFSSIFDVLGPLIDKMSDARNLMINKVFNSKFNNKAWVELAKQIKNAGVDLNKFQNELVITGKKHGKITDEMISKSESFEESLQSGWMSKEVVIETLQRMSKYTEKASDSQQQLNNKLKVFQEVVDRVWKGDFKNGAERIRELTKAGYDYAKVQDLINKTVDGHRLALDDLSETQLEAVGYTKEEIKAIQALTIEASKANTPISKLMDDLTRPSGKVLLFDSFKNMFEAIKKPVEAFSKAWEKIFPTEEREHVLYDMIKGFNELSEALIISDASATNFERIMSGLLSLFKLTTMSLKLGLTSAIKIASAVLSLFGTDLLTVVAYISDYIVKLTDWITQSTFFINTNDKIAKVLKAVIDGIKGCVDAFMRLTVVQKTIETVSNAINNLFNSIELDFNGFDIDGIVSYIEQLFSKIQKIIESLDSKITFEKLSEGFDNFVKAIQSNDFYQVGKDIINGLVKGIQNGAQAVWDAIVDMANTMVEKICSFLGIHSPSRVFMDIGENIVKGLVIGIQNGVSFLAEIIRFLVDTIKNIFSDVDFTDVALVGSIGVLAFLVNKLIGVLKTLTSIPEGIGGVLSSIKSLFSSISKWVDSKTLNNKANAIKTIAQAITILVGSLIALTLVDHSKLWGAVGALTAVSAILVAISFVTKKMDTVNLKNISGLSVLMISLGISLSLMASVVKKLSEIDPNRAIPAAIGMTGLIIAIGGILFAIKKISEGGLFGEVTANASKLGTMLLKISLSLMMMVGVVKLISLLSEDEINRGVSCILKFSGIFAGLTLISKFAGKNSSLSGSMFIKLSFAISSLVMVMKLIGGLSPSELSRGMYVIQTISGLMGALMLLSGFVNDNVGKLGTYFMKIGVAVGLMAIAVKLIAGLSVDELIKAGLFITGCGTLFALIANVFGALSYNQGNDISKAGNVFIKMAIAMGGLSLAIKSIAGLSLSEILKGLSVVTACQILFLAITKISNYAGENASQAGNMILKMSIAMGALAIVIRLLRGLSEDDIKKGMIFMAGVTAVFSALIAVSALAGRYGDKAGEMLMKMAVPIGVLAGSIALLTFLDQTKLAKATMCMMGIVGVFSILVGASGLVKKASITVVILAAVVAELAGVLWLLQGLPVESTLVNALAISTLLLAMTDSLGMLSRVKHISKGALGGMIALSGAITLLSVIMGVLNKMNIQLSIETASSLSMLLVAMSAVCVVLSSLGPVAHMAMAGALAFDAIVGIIGGLMVSIGALVPNIPNVKKFLTDGISLFTELMQGLGTAFGSFFGGALGGLGSALPILGIQLTEFMTNIQGFLTGANNIKPESMAGIESLAKAILALTAADVIGGLASLFGGSTDISKFADKLEPLGKGIKAYGDAVSGIDTTGIDASIKAVKGIVDIANSLPNEGGLLAKIVGENDLSTFADKLPKFGTAIKEYANSVAGIDTSGIDPSITAANGLVEVSKSIPNEGGWLAKIVGENDIDGFGSKLKSFGESIKDYSLAVVGVESDPIINSVKAAKGLVDLANAIPNEGGLWSVFSGENSIDEFGTGLESFGTSLAKYSAAVSGESINVEAITSSAIVAMKLVDLVNLLPEKDGLGDKAMSLNTFGSRIASFGPSLSTYASSIASINFEQVTASASSIGDLIKAIKKMEGLQSEGAIAFTNSINSLATANVSGFVNAFNGSVKEMTSVGESISKSISTGISNSKSAVTGAINNIMSAAKTAVTNAGTGFKSAGVTLIEKLKTGINSKSNGVKKAVSILVSNALSSISEYDDDFYNSGANLVAGFVKGIESESFKASLAAAAMASKASEAARKNLQVNSPSKVFRRIGQSVPEGFVQGINMMGNYIKSSTNSMSNKAVEGTRKAIARLSRIINSDIDTQPTIRPIMDLTDITDGVNSINDMLLMDTPVGTLSTMNSISSMMNNRIQNGGNGEVISAIKDLGKAISKSSGTTYNVNGVTYDDGSNVSQAVSDLIRAIKMEERS